MSTHLTLPRPVPVRAIRLPSGARGFTLIESIVVLVLLALASAGIIMLVGNIQNSQTGNETLQVGMKSMQECAEHVLKTRKAATDFAAFVPSCPSASFPVLSGFSALNVATDGSYTGAGCPSGTGISCKLVTISITATDGGALTPITLLLVGS